MPAARSRPASPRGAVALAAACLLTILPILEPNMCQAAPRDTDTHHLFTPATSRAAWDRRAAGLRAQLLFALGLDPALPRTPLRPIVTGSFEGPDFTVDNVAIETMPGVYLCGNLYRPKGKPGPFPAVANPHGHWETGRFTLQPDVARAAPAPAPPAEGHSNLVAIGVTLARQGIVVFAYDMLGVNDTTQLGSHRGTWTGLRDWIWGISPAAMQTWNSMRAVDFLESLPYVDRSRIGATGASGGGTQTFLLAALDKRIAAAVPVNMVSAYMQGGCVCENAPGLRIGTDNAEIAALIAPRPLLLVCCTGDWTSHVPKEEGPAIRKVYDLFGAGERFSTVQFNYQHNYNIESREAMYAWLGRWLSGRKPGAPVEAPFDLDIARMHVWTPEHPLPADAPDATATGAVIRREARAALERALPRDPGGVPAFRRKYGALLARSLDVRAPYARFRTSARPQERAALVVSAPDGRDEAARLRDLLTQRGVRAVALDLEAVTATEQQMEASFFSCYNRVPLGDRVQAIVDALAGLRKGNGGRADLVGCGQAGIWALFAQALAPGTGALVADAGRLDTSSDSSYVPALYAPGLRRAGDIVTAAALCGASAACLHNTGDQMDVDGALHAFPAKAPLERFREPLAEGAVVDWLLRH